MCFKMRLAENEFITLPALTGDAYVESAMFVSSLSVVLAVGGEGELRTEAQ
jgi:hypothetical protein